MEKKLEEITRRVLATLTPTEKEILRMRFGISESVEEVSKKFAVTLERIRQIEAKALRRLKSPKTSS